MNASIGESRDNCDPRALRIAETLRDPRVQRQRSYSAPEPAATTGRTPTSTSC